MRAANPFQSLLHMIRTQQIPPAVKRTASLLMSLAIMLWLIRGIAEIGWHEVFSVLPATPLFYLLSAASYMAIPVAEYLIFSRWWPLTPRALALFSKKRVLNEAVFGYSGDAWLFMRANQSAAGRTLSPTPLAAIKDVAIMSALAGNGATLLLLALSLILGGGPSISSAFSGDAMQSVGFGFLFVILVSCLILLFSNRVMSLPARENHRVFMVHNVRLLLSGGFLCIAWIIALPEIDVRTWILLGALRMVVTRLPFVPNKELLFAALTVSLTGHAAPVVAALMAAAGTLHMLGHGISYALSWLADNGRPIMQQQRSDLARASE